MSVSSSLWEELARWAIVTLATLTAAFTALVWRWVGDRFKKVDKRLDSQSKRLTDQKDKIANHDTMLAEFKIYTELSKDDRAEIKEAIKSINDKLDRALAG